MEKLKGKRTLSKVEELENNGLNVPIKRINYRWGIIYYLYNNIGIESNGEVRRVEKEIKMGPNARGSMFI